MRNNKYKEILNKRRILKILQRQKINCVCLKFKNKLPEVNRIFIIQKLEIQLLAKIDHRP
jgi:hypothetical protein